jgi:hypothetical protein
MARAAALQGAARDGGQRRARRKIAGDGQKDFPCTKIHGKRTEMKMGTWGTYREAWRGGRGTGEGDRRRGAAVVAVLRGGRAVEREERKGGARG